MNILVTGCSRGVGLEICRVLLEQGHTVYGVARSCPDEFVTLQKQYSERLFYKSVDLSDSEHVRENVFGDFCSNKVRLDGFVNNAAIAYDDIVSNINLDRLKTMYDVNVFSPMVMTKYAIRNMLLHHTKGSIVHISSISVHTGYKGLAMYASSKGALEAFSKNTAREWGSLGIRSKCGCAGIHADSDERYLDGRTESKDLCAYFIKGRDIGSFGCGECGVLVERKGRKHNRSEYSCR